MQKVLTSSLLACALCTTAGLAAPYENTVEFPGVKPNPATADQSPSSPEDDLTSWIADCKRRIKRKWEENKSVRDVDCTFHLSKDGSVQRLKVLKGREQADAAKKILQAAANFRKAPNDLPYKKHLLVEFRDFPELNLQLK
jgi:hypothetical protein